MKKTLFTLALGGLAILAQAQIVNVSSIEKIDLPKGMEVKAAAISPNADFILITDGQNNGLKKWDLSTKTLTTVTDAANAGYKPEIAPEDYYLPGEDIRQTSPLLHHPPQSRPHKRKRKQTREKVA